MRLLRRRMGRGRRRIKIAKRWLRSQQEPQWTSDGQVASSDAEIPTHDTTVTESRRNAPADVEKVGHAIHIIFIKNTDDMSDHTRNSMQASSPGHFNTTAPFSPVSARN